jgi:hypothetical protein
LPRSAVGFWRSWSRSSRPSWFWPERWAFSSWHGLARRLEDERQRLQAIRAAKARIEARAQERYEEEKAAYEAKVEARRAKEAATCKKPGGRAPKPPEPGPHPQDQVNLTDEESRIMPVSSGGFEQAYNVQAAVDVETHLVVAQFATQAPNDKEQVEPALERLSALPEELGTVDHLLADNGFFSEANVEATDEAGIEPLMALGREAHHLPLAERMEVADPPGESATALEEMAYRLKTPEGRALYGKRKSTVEPVFGQIKHVLGFRQFMLRGFAQISGEWTLVTTAYNLRRLFQLKRGRKQAAGKASSGQGAGPFTVAPGKRWPVMIAGCVHRRFRMTGLLPHVA